MVRIELDDTVYLSRGSDELLKLIPKASGEFWKSISRDQLRELSEIAGELSASPASLNSLEARWLQHNDPEEYDRRVELVDAMFRMIDGNSVALGSAIVRTYPPPHLLYLSPPLHYVSETSYDSEEVDEPLARDDEHLGASSE